MREPKRSCRESVTLYTTPTFQFGRVQEGVDLDKARWIADALEDEELLRKQASLT